MTKATRNLIHRLEKAIDSIFSDTEAWFLFQWSARLETLGWVLLLIGILFQVMKWPGEEWLLPVGGSLHGTFVMIYMFIAFFTYRSFKPRWNFRHMLLAEVVSIIPFGALLFVLRMARARDSARK